MLQVLLESRSWRSSQVSLDLEVSHGQEDLVVLQQSGEKTHRFVIRLSDYQIIKNKKF